MSDPASSSDPLGGKTPGQLPQPAIPAADLHHPPQIPAAVHHVELIISTLLRIGVTVSLLTVIAGTVISFMHHPDYLKGKSELAGLTTPGQALPHSVGEIFQGIAEGRGQALVLLGLLLLLATPVMRVAISIFAFLFQKDWTFSIITTVVLLLLLLSFMLGRAE